MEVYINDKKWDRSDKFVSQTPILVSDLLDGDDHGVIWEFGKQIEGKWVE